MIKKSLVVIVVVATLASCKSKQATVSEQAASGTKPAKEIIAGHYKNPHDFTTLLIKADAGYKDKKQSQNVSAEIRIKKDEAILVSVRFIGITMAKALITPKEVSYYEKINGTYFRGDYAVLSRWLGTELNYAKVQNMLIGEAMDDLTKGNYKATVEDGLYKLSGKENGSVTKEFLFEGANYLLKQQHVAQAGNEPRSLDISYPAHSSYPQMALPSAIKIEAEQKEQVTIDIEYTSVKFNESLTFPYEVPEGFEQIFIEK